MRPDVMPWSRVRGAALVLTELRTRTGADTLRAIDAAWGVHSDKARLPGGRMVHSALMFGSVDVLVATLSTDPGVFLDPPPTYGLVSSRSWGLVLPPHDVVAGGASEGGPTAETVGWQLDRVLRWSVPWTAVVYLRLHPSLWSFEGSARTGPDEGGPLTDAIQRIMHCANDLEAEMRLLPFTALEPSFDIALLVRSCTLAAILKLGQALRGMSHPSGTAYFERLCTKVGLAVVPGSRGAVGLGPLELPRREGHGPPPRFGFKAEEFRTPERVKVRVHGAVGRGQSDTQLWQELRAFGVAVPPDGPWIAFGLDDQEGHYPAPETSTTAELTAGELAQLLARLHGLSSGAPARQFQTRTTLALQGTREPFDAPDPLRRRRGAEWDAPAVRLGHYIEEWLQEVRARRWVQPTVVSGDLTFEVGLLTLLGQLMLDLQADVGVGFLLPHVARLVRAATRVQGKDEAAQPPPVALMSSVLNDLRRCRVQRAARASPFRPALRGLGDLDHHPGGAGPSRAVDLLLGDLFRALGISALVLVCWRRGQQGHVAPPLHTVRVVGAKSYTDPEVFRVYLPRRLQWSMEQWGRFGVTAGEAILEGANAATITQWERAAKAAGNTVLSETWASVETAARVSYTKGQPGVKHGRRLPNETLRGLLDGWATAVQDPQLFQIDNFGYVRRALVRAGRRVPAWTFALGLCTGAARELQGTTPRDRVSGFELFFWSAGPSLAHDLRWRSPELSAPVAMSNCFQLQQDLLESLFLLAWVGLLGDPNAGTSTPPAGTVPPQWTGPSDTFISRLRGPLAAARLRHEPVYQDSISAILGAFLRDVTPAEAILNGCLDLIKEWPDVGDSVAEGRGDREPGAGPRAKFWKHLEWAQRLARAMFRLGRAAATSADADSWQLWLDHTNRHRSSMRSTSSFPPGAAAQAWPPTLRYAAAYRKEGPLAAPHYSPMGWAVWPSGGRDDARHRASVESLQQLLLSLNSRAHARLVDLIRTPAPTLGTQP